MSCLVLDLSHRTYYFAGYGTIRLPNYLYVCRKKEKFVSFYVQATRLNVQPKYFTGDPQSALAEALEYMTAEGIELRYTYKLRKDRVQRAPHDDLPSGISVSDGYVRLYLGQRTKGYSGPDTPENRRKAKELRESCRIRQNQTIPVNQIQFT